MALAPPPLPTRFPCWVRAVYSWGGESKRDLGFVEGDLIECLNAGDGSWWTGRLWRDRRMIGVFPSNFVEVLPENFRPMSRSTSPLPNSNTPSPKNTPQKSRTFRKPFEAYAKAPHYTTAKVPETYKESPVRTRNNSSISFKNAPEAIDRVPSPPQVHGYGSRAPSPAPSFNYQQQYRQSVEDHRRQQQQQHQPPHQPPQQRYQQNMDDPDSPPPLPPPHRHALTSRHGSNASYDNRVPEHISRHNSNASYDNRVPEHMSRHNSGASYDHRSTGYHTPRMPSPSPPSPGAAEGLTPSPLREAMDDVMEQLDALGVPRETESPEPPFDPWSPESFDMLHHSSRKKREHLRPQTSMGIAQHPDEGYETYSGSGSSSRDQTHQSGYVDREQPLPQLSNYVERMETRLRSMHQHNSSVVGVGVDDGPPPPPKNSLYDRPKSSIDVHGQPERKLRHKKSAYEVGRQMLGRTFTNKTNSTSTSSGNRSTTTQSTDRSLMSGTSAGGISATSANSLARKNQGRAQSALGMRELDVDRPETPFTGVTYHSSHASGDPRSRSQIGFHDDSISGLGGLVQPRAKKQNFIKRILESAKTGVASSRGSIATAGAGSINPSSTTRSAMSNSVTGISGGHPAALQNRDAARDMGLNGGIDWVQVRRDVNRSNSLSRNERLERRDRCQMLDYPAIEPVDELYSSIDGDEGADGMPVPEPTNYFNINLSQVDKNSRFVASLPPMTTAITLASTYVCRPYRSDVQRLRAIFTWVAEKICWEEDFEGEIDTRRVIQTKRACCEEYAMLVLEMCAAVGLQCEIVRGYLKTPGEIPETGIMPRSNHWWNAVLVDNEWRMMDCCLASPSNPRRGLYSSMGSSTADPWWFLARPTEICWTHIPEHHAQQHICPPVAHEILLNLPCACPPYFKNGLEMADYNTSLTRIEDLEMVHIKFNVPPDVEVAAEVEVRAYTRDPDGDFFESGDVVRKRALAQAEWFGGVKRYTVKALLPGDEGTGILKVYAGKRGLMHSIKDIPHPLAFALPVIHSGENPAYEFVTRHPTPHAQRHDIYVVQPQCQRLALNNTFVFVIRQHPSSALAAAAAGAAGSPMTPSSNPGGASPIPFVRPGSAMSMTSSSAACSNPSTATSGSGSGGKKPAKLAVQTPGGKILRLMRKEERRGAAIGNSGGGGDEEVGDGGTWETIIKCSERGVWRGLVLADRTARWCVFAEWVCVG
ncbi:hypothetical protein QBC33DRAFT_275597 [Phialemonium atrogriseum]|uniref:SH3 domain-containing protein n=1 Tax=Phialemonium atrogriseum TaxID=1093897 RepID=A0AAJ0FK31_9PEZI|nr:uncharacterized protein QBC33DRAFT_275597 [Phialemonium atrogriseum]KAK1770607.1 hypothetical protein QBC33DRAFT_275597 [Phialemonium atrogriseum]